LVEVEINSEKESSRAVDAVVLAIGGVGAASLVRASLASAAATEKETDETLPLFSNPVVKQFDKLRGVTCVATRLFLRPDSKSNSNSSSSSSSTGGLLGGAYTTSSLPRAVTSKMEASPVVVCGAGIICDGDPSSRASRALADTGFCFYDLQRLHDEFAVGKDAQGGEKAAVLEVDFYR
jgi:hypothetical protein